MSSAEFWATLKYKNYLIRKAIDAMDIGVSTLS